jgi:predicted metalloprotease with PDZ domain
VKRKPITLVFATALFATGALAERAAEAAAPAIRTASVAFMMQAVAAAPEAPATPASPGAPAAPAAPAPPAAPPVPSAGQEFLDGPTEAQLEAARRKLEAAARELAALSARMNTQLMEHMSGMDHVPHRAIIGVQLEASKEGALVREVSPGGPAAEAGIRGGDLILAVNGTQVKGDNPAHQVLNIMRDVKPDSKVTVRVLREGKPRDFTVTPRQVPNRMAWADMPDISKFNFEGFPEIRTPFLMHGPLADMELVTLTPRLGRYFGADKGVLVVRAPADGGLKLEDGDIILTIDGREPTSGSHATRILASYQPGEKIALRIMREHKTLNVDTTLPEQSRPRRPASLHEHERQHSSESGHRTVIIHTDAQAT